MGGSSQSTPSSGQLVSALRKQSRFLSLGNFLFQGAVTTISFQCASTPSKAQKTMYIIFHIAKHIPRMTLLQDTLKQRWSYLRENL